MGEESAEEFQQRLEEDPDWQVYQKAKQEKEFEGTSQGMILKSLEEQAQKEGTEASFKMGDHGRNEYRYGDQSAVEQLHLSPGGVAVAYTNMLDLQKEWWRKAFLEDRYGGDINKIGLFAPSLLETIELKLGKEGAEQFRIDKLLQEAGLEGGEVEEFAEYEMYSGQLGKAEYEIITKITQVLRAAVQPNFDIRFDNGGGDMWRKIRLVPLNREAQLALINGGPILDAALTNIVDNHTQLVEALKAA
ncbi:hypothetical protein HOG17_00695 [Candidatus Peregrinibacteria bacterium]|nr:hypothetical protein [Candidatus Peregrinibacteria bacterium]MBT4148630.1 hypothetical protein [Candidatus Peregrinibacteria bacterium]MBT4366235.1 hypothetical protein [Candidatus Peregrinibacteria bacterium]MBT4456039.1 hypothetical protein [Candidatus Peregrinibacteria bacterium]